MNDYKKLCENLVQRTIENTYPRPDWWRVRVKRHTYTWI